MNAVALDALPFRRRLNVIAWLWLDRIRSAVGTLDPAGVMKAMEQADRDLTEQPKARFGPRWGEGVAAQEAQDSALATLGITIDDLPTA